MSDSKSEQDGVGKQKDVYNSNRCKHWIAGWQKPVKLYVVENIFKIFFGKFRMWLTFIVSNENLLHTL